MTATIYAHALREGDTTEGRTVQFVNHRDTVTVTWTDGTRSTLDPHERVTVDAATGAAPGAATIWVPTPGVWPLGCTCPMRRHPDLAGNWTIVPSPDRCWDCTPRDDD